MLSWLINFTVFFSSSTDDIPESLLRQMTTAQTAANEFLRQFWLAIYPTSADPPPGPPPTPAQKAEKVAKAARMAGFLARTPEKVDALVREAQRQGVEYVKVETVCGCCFMLLDEDAKD
jgi:transcription initiation factor TFIIH subunit 1